jgi:maleylacetoacetate isomerase
MSDLVLYSYFRSSASYRARIALHTKGLDFVYKPVHLLNNGGEQNSPQYRDLNPSGEVPTLVHKNHTLSQSMSIILYLDECFPRTQLLSADSYQRARMIQFCEGINCTQPYQNLRTLQYLENSLKISEDQKQNWLNFWLQRNLESSEKILSQTAGQFCFGDSISIADCFLVPQIFSAQRFKVISENWSQQYPHLFRVNSNCLKLESVQKAHPFRQPDTPEDMKILAI